MHKTVVIIIYAIAFATAALVTARTSPPPNIVFLFADDYGWNDVGFHGSRQVKTPVLDAMASEGVILNNYYVVPMCTPSRAALMTGRHPVRTGMQFKVVVTGQRLGLPLNFKIMPQYLNDLGYESHAVGKWHLGNFHKHYLPTFRGFKTFYGIYNGKCDMYDHREIELGMYGLDWHLDEGDNLTNLYSEFGLYTTRAFADRSKKIIEEHDFVSKPLFLYVPFQSVHSALYFDPLQVPIETEALFQDIWHVPRRKYVGMVKEMDDAVGRIKDALAARSVLNNTIIVFSTDNGGAPNGFNMNWASNYPLRSAKGYFYEGGTRGVAFVYGEMFKQRSGQISTEMMHVTDWLPTFYEAAGGDVADLGDIDSFSMLDLLTGKNLTSPRSEVLVNLSPPENAKAIRVGRYKYLLNPNDRYSGNVHDGWYEAPGNLPGTNETMVPGTTPAQIHCEKVPYGTDFSCYSKKSRMNECIFDIEKDPCEYYNLIDDDEYAGVKRQLLDRIKHWESLQLPPMIPPIDFRSDPKYFDNAWTHWTDDPTIPENEDYRCNPKHCPDTSKVSDEL